MAENDNQNFTEEEYLKDFGVTSKAELATKLQELEGKAAKVAELEPLVGKAAEYEQKYNEVNGKYSTLETEYNSYKQTVKPPANDLAKFVGELAEKGLDDDTIIRVLPLSKLKPDAMKDDEVIKTAALIKNKGWQPQHAEADYKTKFFVDPDDTETPAEQKTLREAARITAANESRDFLKDYTNKAFTPKQDIERQQREAKAQELNQFWSSKVPEIAKTVRTFKGEAPYIVPGGKGPVEIKPVYEFTVPDKELDTLIPDFVQRATNGLVPNTQEGVNQVTDYIKERLQARYFNKIQEAERVATNNGIIDFMKAEFNVELPQKGAGSGAGGGGGSKGGKPSYEQNVFSHMGKRLNPQT